MEKVCAVCGENVSVENWDTKFEACVECADMMRDIPDTNAHGKGKGLYLKEAVTLLGKRKLISRKYITSFNALLVEAGSNCPQGGDSGHGGRTYIKIKDMASTCWEFRIVDDCGKHVFRFEQPTSLEIVLGGDSEYKTMIEALQFVLEVLKKGESAV